MQIERGFARTFAGHIHYRACGRGPAVMISHINQQSSALMLELLQALSTDFRAVAIDYPSHGNSDHVTQQPSIEDYARCVLETMDHLGIARAHLLGEAVGAGVSIALAANSPARVEKAILVNIPYFGDAENAKRDIADIARVRPSDPSGFPAPRTLDYVLTNDPEHAPMHPSQSWMDRINVAQLEIGRDRWQAMSAFSSFDILPTLARVSCPLLVLYGEKFIYGKHRDLMQKHAPKATIETVPNGRFCMTWERAEDIAAHARHFLRT